MGEELNIRNVAEIRNKFKSYLDKFSKLLSPNADDIIKCCEDVGLIQFMSKHTNMQISSLYDIKNHKLCEEARNILQNDGTLKYNNLYSQTLKHYAAFLESPKFNPKKEVRETKLVIKELTEGGKTHTEYERRYRNPELRRKCIAEYGWVCQVCGFDFSKAYGEDLGANFIEVHHLEPISNYDKEHKVNPLQDLVPLCSNCHSMIHHGKDGPLTLKQMREIYQGKRWEIPKLKEDEH